MFIRFTKSALIAALVLAGAGAARADGLNDVRDSLDRPGCTSRIVGAGSTFYEGYPSIASDFAVEGGCARGAWKFDDATTTVSLRGVFDSPVGRYEFAPKWSLLGVGGIANGRLATTGDDDSSRTLELGTGVQYELSKQVSLRADYEHYHFSDPIEGKPRLGEVSLGLRFGF